MLYFLLSTLVLTLYIDVVLSLSIRESSLCFHVHQKHCIPYDCIIWFKRKCLGAGTWCIYASLCPNELEINCIVQLRKFVSITIISASSGFGCLMVNDQMWKHECHNCYLQPIPAEMSRLVKRVIPGYQYITLGIGCQWSVFSLPNPANIQYRAVITRSILSNILTINTP